MIPRARSTIGLLCRRVCQTAAASTRPVRCFASTRAGPVAIPSKVRHLSTSQVSRHEKSPADEARSRQSEPSFADPISRYEHLVETGVLKPDSHQRTIIEKLQRLWTDLKDYDPGKIPQQTEEISPSFFGKFFSRTPSTPSPTVPLNNVPKGLYLYGSVGTGKTMLMDLFHSTLPPQFNKDEYGSNRIHFHSFMLDVLQRQHTVKARYEKMGAGKKDAMPEVARSLAAEGRVLCFDEFQVTDIVTAMILRQLLERLMGFGVVCVMTSNRHPDELYINGIQRQSFVPAIELIKEKFEVVDLDSPTDYRKIPRALKKVYYHPLDSPNRQELNKIFTSLASTDPISKEIRTNAKLRLWGRELVIPESTGTVARFTFGDLCNKPLSAADYLELTGKYATVFVEGIPRMGLSERDQARRFITFIDACYENKTKLFASSEVPIFQVFSDKHSDKSASADGHMREVMDDLGLDANAVGSSSLFSSDEELFAFARCVSRLNQMGTKEWSETAGR